MEEVQLDLADLLPYEFVLTVTDVSRIIPDAEEGIAFPLVPIVTPNLGKVVGVQFFTARTERETRSDTPHDLGSTLAEMAIAAATYQRFATLLAMSTTRAFSKGQEDVPRDIADLLDFGKPWAFGDYEVEFEVIGISLNSPLEIRVRLKKLKVSVSLGVALAMGPATPLPPPQAPQAIVCSVLQTSTRAINSADKGVRLDLRANGDEARIAYQEKIYQQLRHAANNNNDYVLQKTLFDLGFYYGPVDGQFGSQSERALRSFAERYGLNPAVRRHDIQLLRTLSRATADAKYPAFSD